MAFISELFDPAVWHEVDGFGELSDITYHHDTTGRIARVAFNRPEVRNAFRPQSVDELYRALDHARQDTAIGVVLVTGNGPSPKDGGWAFCSGGDQDDIIAELFARDARGLLEFTRLTGRLIASIRTVRRPVVAAIHGACVGAGAVIAAALSDPQDLGQPFGSWTLDRLVAYLSEQKALPIKRSRISELLVAEGLRWRQQETWFGERVDPTFAEKRGASKPFTRPFPKAAS